jgi:MFS family permease
MVMTVISSYLYELLGRKLTIFASFFTTAIVYFFIPYTSPDVNKLIILRCLIGVTMAAPL